MDILRSVDEYCREKGIRYFLAYGTLLGAVRHKGYIPWDDDIDIVMLRKDYECFLSEFNKGRNDSLQVLHSSIDKDFPYEFAKIHDKNTKFVGNVAIKYDIGIPIDLFVLDNFPTEKDAPKLYEKSRFARKTLSYKTWFFSKKGNFIKQMAKKTVKFLVKFRSVYHCTSKIDKISRRYENDNTCPYVANICQRWFKGHQVVGKEIFDNCIELEFEGFEFIAPENYDKILTVKYGDYMQLPPKEQQVAHHNYKAYKK